jgi:hypothetical protein
MQVLARPAPAGEEDDEEKPTEVAPITMKLLDENIPSLHVPNTLEERAVKYHNGFPGIGSYYAAAVQQQSGRFSSILAADTLVPHGDGQPLSDEDRAFIWDMALVVAKCLERYPAARIEARKRPGLEPSIEDVREALKAIRGGGGPPAQEGNSAGEGEAELKEGEGGAGDAAPAEDGAPVDEEEEETKLDPEADPAAQVEHFSKQVFSNRFT